MLLGLQLRNREIISAKNISDPRSMFFGSTLAPWPNRLRDGRYLFAGKEYQFDQLDTENNLNHGLVAKRDFVVANHTEDSLLLRYDLGFDEGYPFRVTLELEYVIENDQLMVSALATNRETTPVPFAIGFHPYFLAGADFTLGGSFTRQTVTDDRMLPMGEKEIDGLHFTGGEIDDCFSGSQVALLSTNQGEIEVELGENLSHFMFYRPDPSVGESLIAIEPMSAKANVFADDIDSALIAPGQKRFSYRIRMR